MLFVSFLFALGTQCRCDFYDNLLLDHGPMAFFTMYLMIQVKYYAKYGLMSSGYPMGDIKIPLLKLVTFCRKTSNVCWWSFVDQFKVTNII